MKPIDQLSDDEFSRQVQRAVRELPDAPAALQRAAIALWPAPAPAGTLQSAVQAVLAQVAAVLSFDSWATPALAQGMRSLRASTRHLLYSAEGRDIDLRIAPAPGSMFSLQGQILGPDEAGAIELTRIGAAQPDATAALDALGEFRIDALPRGSYRLTLRVDGAAIVVEPLEVGETVT